MVDVRNVNETDVVVIGAGISGLFAAHELLKNNYKVTILEKAKFAGGLSTSIKFHDSFCDIGPHFIGLIEKSPITHIIKSFLEENKRIDIPDLHDYHLVFFDNKLQKTLPTLYQFIFKFGFSNTIKSLFAFLQSKFIQNNQSTFFAENYLKSTFGNYLFQKWFKPYILHTYGTLNVSEKIIIEKFPPITLNRMQKFFRKRNITSTSNHLVAKNCYPKFGMHQIIKSIQDKTQQLGGEIILGADIFDITHNNKKIIRYKQNNVEKTITSTNIVYSTAPNVSIRWFKDYTNPSNGDTSLNSIIIFLLFESEKLFDGWLINIYDSNLIFFRLSQQNFLSPDVTPKGITMLTVEIKCDSDDEVWKMNDEVLLSKIKNDLKKSDFKTDFVDSKVIHLPSIYPILSDSQTDNRKNIIEHINSFKNEYTVGTADPDTGRFASSESTENLSLGGFYVAIQNSISLVNNIVSHKND